MEAVERITDFPCRISRGAATALQQASLLLKLTTRFAQALLLLFCGLLSSTVLAKEPVYFAGVALLGDFQYINKNYPLARELDSTGAVFNEALVSALKGSEVEHLDIRYELGDLDRTSANVLAIALDRERISREQFEFGQGLRTKIVVEASFQILVYNLASGILVDSVPVPFAINHVIADDNQDVDLKALGRELYFGSDGEESLIQLAVKKLQEFQPATADSLRYRLVSLDWHDRVLEVLGERDSDHVAQVFGQWFSSQLSELTRVSVIPFNRGYAFGNQLPGRFLNGEAFNLKLPDPDLAFHIVVSNLSQQTEKDLVHFRVQAGFKMEEPFTGKTLIEGDFRTGVPKTATEMRVLSDDWSAYEDSVENFFDELINQMKSPEKRWHRTHARAEKSYSQFTLQQDKFND